MFPNDNGAEFLDDDGQGAGSALLSSDHVPKGWREVDASLLEEDHPTVPALPLDVLPPSWRDWVSSRSILGSVLTSKSANNVVDWLAVTFKEYM